MAALTATDWVVAEIDYPHNRRIMNGGDRSVYCSMTLATVGTYPSGGVPIPTTAAKWGLKNVFKRLNIIDGAHGDGGVWKYSATGQVMRCYQDNATTSDGGTSQADLIEMATTASAGTGGNVILYVEAYGS